MKNSRLVYVAVAVVGALAGIAIAGSPNMVGTDATIVVPEATTTSTTIIATAPSTTISPTPEADSGQVATTTGAETLATTTTVAELTTTVVEVAPAEVATTTVAGPRPEIDRAAVVVVAVNGSGVAGSAGRVSDELRDLGFVQTRTDDGIAVVDATIVYHAVGFGAEAVDVAGVLGLGPGDVRPIAEAPSFDVPSDLQVAVYIGRDVA